MTPIYVDTNIHVIAPPNERAQYPLNIAPGTDKEFTEDQSNSPRDFVLKMDEAGLDQAYLMASRFHGFDNSYCADAIADAPKGRFVGVANIDILAEDAPAKISYWIEGAACTGFASGAVVRSPGTVSPATRAAALTTWTIRKCDRHGSAFANWGFPRTRRRRCRKCCRIRGGCSSNFRSFPSHLTIWRTCRQTKARIRPRRGIC